MPVVEEEEELPRIKSRDRRQKWFVFLQKRQQPATTPYEGWISPDSKIPVPSSIGQDDITCEQQESSRLRSDSCVVPQPVEDTHLCPDDAQVSKEDPYSGNVTASEDFDLRRSSCLKKPRMLYDPTS